MPARAVADAELAKMTADALAAADAAVEIDHDFDLRAFDLAGQQRAALEFLG